mgnify:CR=1 FL=1
MLFRSFLQMQLQLGAAVHLAEQFLVLAFQLDIDAGAQQLAVAGDAAGEVFLAAGEPTSALVQWLRLAPAERREGEGLDATLVAQLNDAAATAQAGRKEAAGAPR